MIYSTGRILLSLALCCVLEFFSPFSIAITSFWEERAGLCAFRALLYFARVGVCLFPLSLGVRDKLRIMIVAHL